MTWVPSDVSFLVFSGLPVGFPVGFLDFLLCFPVGFPVGFLDFLLCFPMGFPVGFLDFLLCFPVGFPVGFLGFQTFSPFPPFGKDPRNFPRETLWRPPGEVKTFRSLEKAGRK